MKGKMNKNAIIAITPVIKLKSIGEQEIKLREKNKICLAQVTAEPKPDINSAILRYFVY